jgi:ATP-dependent Clp protease protease subunit
MVKKRLGNDFQIPQTSVERVGRKILFNGEIDEISFGEFQKILFEIEAEDDDFEYQKNAEQTLSEIANVLENEQEKLTKREEMDIVKTINQFKRNTYEPNVFDREPIHLYLNSFGGSLYDCMGIVDLIRNLKTPVHSYCFGKCMSAGMVIFTCTDKRFISRNSTVMIHQLSGGYIGKYQDMEENVEESRRMQELMEDLIMLHTYIDEEFLEELRYRKFDCYLDAEKCIELGIADEII